MNVLLKSAKIINATSKQHHLKKRDILIRNGVIEKIAPKIEAEGRIKIVDLKNLHVSLGWFDSGVSFGEPGFEERETISAASILLEQLPLKPKVLISPSCSTCKMPEQLGFMIINHP